MNYYFAKLLSAKKYVVVALLFVCGLQLIINTYPDDGLGDGSGETDAAAELEVDVDLGVDEGAGVRTSGTVPSLGAMERV